MFSRAEAVLKRSSFVVCFSNASRGKIQLETSLRAGAYQTVHCTFLTRKLLVFILIHNKTSLSLSLRVPVPRPTNGTQKPQLIHNKQRQTQCQRSVDSSHRYSYVSLLFTSRFFRVNFLVLVCSLSSHRHSTPTHSHDPHSHIHTSMVFPSHTLSFR